LGRSEGGKQGGEKGENEHCCGARGGEASFGGRMLGLLFSEKWTELSNMPLDSAYTKCHMRDTK
jgi:hypothetical protein